MQNKTVLIVEDDFSIREVFRQVLELDGYDVVTAKNGKEGLEVLRSHPSQPRIIFLDLMMPVMDGWQFLAERKTDKRLAGIPVVVMSAAGHKARPEGIESFVEKPFELNDILKTAQDYCQLCA